MHSDTVVPSVASSEVLLVLTTWPDSVGAQAIAQSLVAQQLAACVQVLGVASSVYRWQGVVETAQEVPLLIKTTRAQYPVLEETLQAQHPYAVPEIIALGVSEGLPAYLQWVVAETTVGDRK